MKKLIIASVLGSLIGWASAQAPSVYVAPYHSNLEFKSRGVSSSDSTEDGDSLKAYENTAGTKVGLYSMSGDVGTGFSIGGARYHLDPISQMNTFNLRGDVNLYFPTMDSTAHSFIGGLVEYEYLTINIEDTEGIKLKYKPINLFNVGVTAGMEMKLNSSAKLVLQASHIRTLIKSDIHAKISMISLREDSFLIKDVETIKNEVSFAVAFDL